MIIHNCQQRSEELVGKIFNNFTILKRLDNSKDGHKRYLCKCNCGNECIVEGRFLRSGKRKKCPSCAMKDVNKKHGLKYTRIYNIWSGIKSRCLNKNNKDYKRYGGRGIKICDEWKNDVNKFKEWAMLSGYKDNLTIDRIDNNYDYCPENCRWVDNIIQQRNKRNNVLVKYNGSVMTAAECSKYIGISSGAMANRIKRHPNDKRIFEKQWKDTKWKNQFTTII